MSIPLERRYVEIFHQRENEKIALLQLCRGVYASRGCKIDSIRCWRFYGIQNREKSTYVAF